MAFQTVRAGQNFSATFSALSLKWACHRRRYHNYRRRLIRIYYVSWQKCAKVQLIGFLRFAMYLSDFWGRRKGLDFSKSRLSIFPLPIVGKQVFKVFVWVFGQALDDVSHVRPRFNAMSPACREDRQNHGVIFSTLIAAEKQPSFFAHGNIFHFALANVIIDCEIAVFYVLDEAFLNC